MSAEGQQALFDYPDRAWLGRVVPKTRIYGHAGAPRSMQQRFAAQIGRIDWSHKLSADTLNLKAGSGVAEIQIFTVHLKPGIASVDDALLRTIDRAIPSPVLFELRAAHRIETAAAHKRANHADPAKWVIGDYLHGGWSPPDAERRPLPPALDMAGLYRALLRSLIPLPARAGEGLDDQLARLASIRSLERDCTRLQARIKREKQFNRKVEINRCLRECTAQLEALRG